VRPAFDFHTLSLTIDNTLDEYRRITGLDQGLNLLGLNIGEIIAGDRSKFLVFRHEHAHFTSFTSAGLTDLYTVFADYLAMMLFLVLQRACVGQRRVRLPLVAAGGEREIGDPPLAAAYGAWQQVNMQRASLFGFGVRTTRDALVDIAPQEAFWQAYRDDRFALFLARYVDVLQRLRSAPQLGDGDSSAEPLVRVGGRPRRLSAAAVMEAYALTIEVVSTHFRKVETELTAYEREIVRNPGALYTVAVEYALQELLGDEPVTLADFLEGKAPLDFYYALPLIAYSAMQVPVIVLPSENVAIFGDLRTLSPAHRFFAIMAGIRQGVLPRPPANLRNAEDADDVCLDWLRKCHDHLGDEWSLTMARDSHVAFERETAKGAVPSGAKLFELTWAARANFYNEPSEFVLDGGLYSERFAAQPRYLRTSDGRVVVGGERDDARYIADHAVPILEAAVFGRQWDSGWAKMPELREDQRLGFVEAALVYFTWAFHFSPSGVEPELPVFELAV
jgi:hypothetical protein